MRKYGFAAEACKWFSVLGIVGISLVLSLFFLQKLIHFMRCFTLWYVCTCNPVAYFFLISSSKNDCWALLLTHRGRETFSVVSSSSIA